jgi:Mn2+/Fe2+ NRAMP family transporter
MLDQLAQGPLLPRLRGYLSLSGPGYLQSALTLGAGTATASLFSGAVFGYQLLWVAPLSMALGVIVLAAVAHQTLSTGLRPLPAMRRHAGKGYAWLWAASSLLASVVWHIPQYNLAANSLTDLLAA